MLPGSKTEVGLNPTNNSILIVDDDSGIRTLLKKLLERQKFEVHEACDGVEALEVLKDTSVHCIVTDVMMPRMSGIQLLGELTKKHPLIPVIIITGKPAIEAAVECMKNGAYDYISKPFEFEQIKTTIVNALAARNKQVEEKQESGSSTSVFNITNRRFFGDYKILQVLGEGNIGIVFLAQKKDENKKFALKILKPTFVTQTHADKSQKRFLTEAEAITRVQHPNVVEIIEYGLTKEENIPFMVMDFISGKSLNYYIVNAGKLDFRQKLEIIMQIADALTAIHGEGICHRDIKPHNIILTRDLEVKVTDFGIAKMPDSSMTMTYELIGSPAYLSPEGFNSSRVDSRADIFSLGVLAYELLLGRKPFVADSISRFAHLIQNEKPEAPSRFDPDFPVAVENVLASMLKKDPDERCQTAEVVRDSLQNILVQEDLYSFEGGEMLTFSKDDWK